MELHGIFVYALGTGNKPCIRIGTYESLERLIQRLEKATRETWFLVEDPSIDNPLLVDASSRCVVVNPEHDTVPSSSTTQREFFRVCLIARLAESLGPPPGQVDGFVGMVAETIRLWRNSTVWKPLPSGETLTVSWLQPRNTTFVSMFGYLSLWNAVNG